MSVLELHILIGVSYSIINSLAPRVKTVGIQVLYCVARQNYFYKSIQNIFPYKRC